MAGQAFVGARWPLAEIADALAATSRASRALGEGTLAAGLLALVGEGMPEPTPEFAELGAVDAGASTGPQVLWRRGEQRSPSALDRVLSARPDLVEGARPLALELAVTRPRDCWVGVVVSRQIGLMHRLDRELLDEVLARVTGRPT